MSSAATNNTMKKGTRSQVTSSVVKSNSLTRRPYLCAALAISVFAICATTTQVVGHKINKTVMPPLSLDDALEYLSLYAHDEGVADENGKYTFTNNGTSRGPVVKSYAHNLSKQFLNYFFDELEQNRSIFQKNLVDYSADQEEAVAHTARFIQVPSSEVASQATGLLKSEVKPLVIAPAPE